MLFRDGRAFSHCSPLVLALRSDPGQPQLHMDLPQPGVPSSRGPASWETEQECLQEMRGLQKDGEWALLGS